MDIPADVEHSPRDDDIQQPQSQSEHARHVDALRKASRFDHFLKIVAS